MDLNTTFKNLESSIQESSTWTPSIMLSSSTMCTMVGNDIVFNMEKSTKSELVDIVKLLNPSPTQKVGALYLKYPNGAIICLEYTPCTSLTRVRNFNIFFLFLFSPPQKRGEMRGGPSQPIGLEVVVTLNNIILSFPPLIASHYRGTKSISILKGVR